MLSVTLYRRLASIDVVATLAPLPPSARQQVCEKPAPTGTRRTDGSEGVRPAIIRIREDLLPNPRDQDATNAQELECLIRLEG